MRPRPPCRSARPACRRRRRCMPRCRSTWRLSGRRGSASAPPRTHGTRPSPPCCAAPASSWPRPRSLRRSVPDLQMGSSPPSRRRSSSSRQAAAAAPLRGRRHRRPCQGPRRLQVPRHLRRRLPLPRSKSGPASKRQVMQAWRILSMPPAPAGASLPCGCPMCLTLPAPAPHDPILAGCSRGC